MGWVVVMILAVGVILSLRLSVIAFGTWFSPLPHYLARWLFLVFLFQINLLGYHHISPWTWALILASIIAFSIGACMTMLCSERKRALPYNHIRDALNISVQPRRLRTGILLLFLIGIGFFVIYLRNMPGAPNPFEAISVLSEVRAALKEETIPGFHYFYFMELVVYLGVFHALMWRKETPYWLFLVTATALFSLLYTTGKVNIAKTIMWCFFALLYLEVFRLGSTRVLKWLLYLLAGGALLFSLMVLNESSDLAGFGDAEGRGSTLLLAYLYMSIPIGVLDKLLADPQVLPMYGAYLFGPILKLGAAMGLSVEIPSHIGEFYETPMPANIATYLDLMYKDFGFAGPLVIPFLIGFLCSFVFAKLRAPRISLFVFSLNTVLALSVFGSTGAANYMKPSYWFQLLALFVLSSYVQKSGVEKYPKQVTQ